MELVREIGRGTYGCIYRARVDGISGFVAVKRFLVNPESDFLFSIQEIELGLKFDHPSLLKAKEIRCAPMVWDLDGREDTPIQDSRDDDACVVYDLAECDIYKLYDDAKINEAKARDIIAQVLLGLEYMHGNGYVHRDIRPSNILHFRGGVVKICDFGYSKKWIKYDYQETVINALYFRAPELLGSTISNGPPADIWAAGCVLHFMFTGDVVSENIDYKLTQEEVKNLSNERQLQGLINKYPYNADSSMYDTSKFTEPVDFKRKTTVPAFMSAYRGMLSDENSYRDFLFRMLAFHPDQRKTATAMLSHTYLADKTETIRKYREKSTDVEDGIHTYEVSEGAHRNSLTGGVMKVFAMHRKTSSWYSDRALFMAAEIYDRLLSRSHKLQGASEANHFAYFKSCLYLSVKYYTPHLVENLYFKTFPPEEDRERSLQEAKKFEETILEILRYDIYRVTLLDEYMSTRPANTLTTMSLLLFTLSGHQFGFTSSQALAVWEKSKDSYYEKAKSVLREISQS